VPGNFSSGSKLYSKKDIPIMFGRKENTMYTGVIAFVVVVTTYFAIMAIFRGFGSTLAVFSVRSAVCVTLGAILGIFVSGLLFETSNLLGYLGMGASIGLMYVLFYSNIIANLINRILENVRNGFRTAFRILRIVLIVAVIICAIFGLLHVIGV